MLLFMADVGFEPVRIRRRRLALLCTSSLYLYIIYYKYILEFSHFGFEGRILVLIVPVPGHCLPLSFGYSLDPPP